MRATTPMPKMLSTFTELFWSSASISRRVVEQFTAACVKDAPLPLVTLMRICSLRWSTQISVTDTSGGAVVGAAVVGAVVGAVVVGDVVGAVVVGAVVVGDVVGGRVNFSFTLPLTMVLRVGSGTTQWLIFALQNRQRVVRCWFTSVECVECTLTPRRDHWVRGPNIDRSGWGRCIPTYPRRTN